MEINNKLFYQLFSLQVLFLSPAVQAQQPVKGDYRMSLKQAIEQASAANKQILAANLEKTAGEQDLNDAKAAGLPSITANSGYQRFTRLTLFSQGLSEHRSIPKIPGPNGADGSLSVNFNLYSGSRNRSFQDEQLHKSLLSEVTADETRGSISLQVASVYLDLSRLYRQQKLALEQINRAQTRLKNIEALFKNQKVTRSDLLRAGVNLSNAELNFRQIENDLLISCKKLNVLMEFEDGRMIEPTDSLDTDSLTNSEIYQLANNSPIKSYGVLKYRQNILIQQAKIKGLQSNYYPSVSLISTYGLNYPNTLFFPPVDQAYSIGFIGLRVQYNLSSLYHITHKVSASRSRLKATHLQQESFRENVNQEADAAAIKYLESGNRIQVIKAQIEQASVNYRIVSAKYFNQLALLTDLLDADNLLQESQYNLIQAQSARQFIAYRLRFLAGSL